MSCMSANVAASARANAPRTNGTSAQLYAQILERLAELGEQQSPRCGPPKRSDATGQFVFCY